jgi:hypothetical protein
MEKTRSKKSRDTVPLKQLAGVKTKEADDEPLDNIACILMKCDF